MKCKKAVLLITLQYDGRITDKQREGLDEHLSQCADCLDYARTYAGPLELLSGVSKMEAPEGGWNSLLQRIEAEETRKRPAYGRLALVAASVVLAAALCVSFMWRHQESSPDRSAVVRPDAVSPLPEKQADNEDTPAVAIAPESREVAVSKERTGRIVRSPGHRQASKLALRPIQHEKPVVLDKQSVISNKPDEGQQAPAEELPVVVDAAEEIASYDDTQLPDMSYEIRDFVTEGMSVLVEASQDLKLSERENQL